MKKYIIIITEILLKIFYIFKIDRDKVIFLSFNGKQYSDSPKYISEKLHSIYKNYKIYWVLINQKI